MTNGTAVLGTQEQMLAKIKELEERLVKAEAKPANRGVSITFLPEGVDWYKRNIKNEAGRNTGRTEMVSVPAGGIYRIRGLTFSQNSSGTWFPTDLDVKAAQFDELKDAVLGQ